ncbi:MAG: DUF3427 domain-containing protein [Candidatus Thermoplasmatota archaeon]|nr:DUF3427 domain-containing protein [Candidatus Thermoplasmatota archaeon]
MLKSGIYDLVINELIHDEIKSQNAKIINKEKIDGEEASRMLASYVADTIEKYLELLREKGASISDLVSVLNRSLESLNIQKRGLQMEAFLIHEPGEKLLSVAEKFTEADLASENHAIVRPDSSISRSSLFTGSLGEPSLYSELKREIQSCDSIDMLVSFIRWSGLCLIMDDLNKFTSRGGRLRVITTSYMGATDIRAVEEISKLPNTQIRISYDTQRTRLHAKTYIFKRESGFSTAYVGSSNLSNAAVSSGLEWNVKVTERDLAETMQKINATFETYWNSKDFELYSPEDQTRFIEAIDAERHRESGKSTPFPFEIHPYAYQMEILEKLKAERIIHNNYRNLVVAATGTGKTVISAFDYRKFCSEPGNSRGRLLFVAHREEILRQSIDCFRGILRNYNFGELMVGNFRPSSLDHLFVSIQSFNSQELFNRTDPFYYDYIVIDEFHHAASTSYQKLLEYYHPRVLMGLTATPERMDGKNVLSYFGNHISAEIRLPEAVDRKLLSPFQYFVITDPVSLQNLRWTRGGYDSSEMEKIYTDEQGWGITRATLIIDSVIKYISDIRTVKGLGFCVSRVHAAFMARQFNEAGINSMTLTVDSPDEERFAARDALNSGKIRFIFVVDLYNEGVDIPEINTILFLRPTESLTVFLQQLGRGLRITEDKDCLTVLDFVGQANRRYDFESKFKALLGKNNRGVVSEIKNGFPNLPAGCYIQLERRATEFILKNIRDSIGTLSGMVSRISSFQENASMELSLENFLGYYHMDVLEIYSKYSFSRLKERAGIIEDFEEPLEKILTGAFSRICSINSRKWLEFLIRVLNEVDLLDLKELTPEEYRMLMMFHFTIWQKAPEKCGFGNLKDGLVKIKENRIMCEELMELLRYNLMHIDFVDEPVDLGFDTPLYLYCSYTRDQILVAFDYLKPGNFREGVKYLPERNIDILFITLNKSKDHYSPSTMYRDYSISDSLFHWQSQNTTSEESPTGQRYVNHAKNGGRVLLFVRENREDMAGASPYTFLGTAKYVSHNGSRPMNIVWKLDRPIPARFLNYTNILVPA